MSRHGPWNTWVNKAYNAVWRRDLWVGTYRGYFDASGASVSVKELHCEIQIDASAERVWKLLTDFDSYPQWNPFIRNIIGQPTPGERLKVRLAPPDGRTMTFKPKVLNAEPDRELRWLGHLLVPGLFDGEHSFTLEALDEKRIRFVQREAFKGLLVPLFARSLETNTQRGFEEMNRALKERAEATPEQD